MELENLKGLKTNPFDKQFTNFSTLDADATTPLDVLTANIRARTEIISAQISFLLKETQKTMGTETKSITTTETKSKERIEDNVVYFATKDQMDSTKLAILENDSLDITDMQNTSWPWLEEMLKTMNFTEQKDLLTPFCAIRDSALLLRDIRPESLNKCVGNSAFTDDIRRIIDDEQRIVDKSSHEDSFQLHMYLRHILPFSFSFPTQVPDSDMQVGFDADDWLAGNDDDFDNNDFNSKERSIIDDTVDDEEDFTDGITHINANVKAKTKASSSSRVHRPRVLPAFLDLSDDEDDENDEDEDNECRNRISSGLAPDKMAATIKKRMQRSKKVPVVERPSVSRPLAAVRGSNGKKGHVLPSTTAECGKQTRPRVPLPSHIDNNAAEKVLLRLPLIRARKATSGVMSKSSAHIVRQSLLRDVGSPETCNSDAFRMLWKSQDGEMAFVPKDPVAALCWPGTINNLGGMKCLGLGLECDLNQLLREIRPQEHEQWLANCAKRHGGEIGDMAADDTAWDSVKALMDMACYGDDGDDHCEAYHATQDDNDGNQELNALDWEEENGNNYNHQQQNHLKRSRAGQDNDYEDQGDFIAQQEHEQQHVVEEQDDGSAAAKKSKRTMSVYDGSSNVVIIGADIPTLPTSLRTATASVPLPNRMLPMSRIQQLLRTAMSSPPNPSSIRLDTIVKTAASIKPVSYARRVFLSLVFLADSHNKKGEARQMHLDEASNEKHHGCSGGKVINVTFQPKLT